MPPKKQAARAQNILKYFANPVPQKEPSIDESCQILYENVQNEPTTTVPLPTKWNSIIENEDKANSTRGRDWTNPLPVPTEENKNKSFNSKDDLKKFNFKGTCIYYPLGEPFRKLEENLVKQIAHRNCCISLPAFACSTIPQIIALTTFNFLKWFENSKALLVYTSEQSVADWMIALKNIGISEDVISHYPKVSTFKTSKSPIGRIVISPLCIVKMLETEEFEQIIGDFRLVMLNIKADDASSKYGQIVSHLIRKDVFFRCAVITTTIAIKSRRNTMNLITNRQQAITNLNLSSWKEQNEMDMDFRSSIIPPGIEVKFWKTEELSDVHKELLEKWKEATAPILKQLFENSKVPSENLLELIWMENRTSETSIAELICKLFRILLIDGIPNAMQYAVEKSGNCHLKYSYLQETVRAFLEINNASRGVIFVKDDQTAQILQAFLRKRFGDVVFWWSETLNDNNAIPMSKLAMMFYERNLDGRIVGNDVIVDAKKSKVPPMKKYEFKYEASRMCVETKNMRLEFFVPNANVIRKSAAMCENLSGLLLTAKERNELFERLKNWEFCEYRRKRKSFLVLNESSTNVEMMDDEMIEWNDSVQYLGNVPSSRLSERFSEYLNGNGQIRSAKFKRKFEYSNEITCETKMETLNKLIRKIDSIF
ncbi:unnamed protein product [Caenorhabditis bovis]|uniref:Uncharacterized protein n=1 Tax=Caenorhabditis bovis TaxID=2654633 RepID=A0A8S1F7E2_9PELO|nr:unnamed protein product [Caenorhabditis bovis]